MKKSVFARVLALVLAVIMVVASPVQVVLATEVTPETVDVIPETADTAAIDGQSSVNETESAIVETESKETEPVESETVAVETETADTEVIESETEVEETEIEETEIEETEEIEIANDASSGLSSYNTVSEKTYSVAPGVEEKKYVMNTDAGNEQIMAYTLTVDVASGEAGLVAGYKDADPSQGWGMQTLTMQASKAESVRGINVVGGINADFFNMATGEPLGALVMNGVEYHGIGNEPYFAIHEDGSAAIYDAGTPIADNVVEAIAGPFYLVKDGVPVQTGGTLYPSAAVGIKADGSVVLMAVDGRQAPTSVGITEEEFGKLLVDMGCVDAIRLDGGGSMTFVTQREGTDDIVIRNSPSDGVERAVSSTLLVYSNAVADGTFDHAALEPNNELYTPGSSVTFTARGVDAAGYQAELPADVTWTLADDSTGLGTIDTEGVFTSNGTTGTVTVNLLSGGSVVGSTQISIVEPDSLTFRNTEVSAAFDADVDLDLIVKYKNTDVNFKDGDFVWTMSNELLGTMNGNVFHSSDGERQEGTITATSVYNSEVSATVNVIVGKEPTIAWDFEDPEYFTIDEYDADGNLSSNFYTANAGRGAKQSAEIITIDSGEPVRFGNSALKINYDFTAPPTGTDGAYFGMTEDIDIPGTPTAIGVWVYAPEGTGNFWLRGYIKDGNGKTNPVDFTLQTSQATEDIPAGIYWEGWKYCEADLSSWTAPFKLAAGLTLRVMYVPGINMGTTTAGSLYFDNLQFVYGANDSDIDSPVIDTMLANSENLQDDMVFDTDTISFEASFHDVENKYTTGIDYDTVNAYIDGINVKDSGYEYALDEGSNKLFLYNVQLTQGVHSFKVLIRDKFGNEAISTKYFTVAGGNSAETAVTLKADAETKPIIGHDFQLNLEAKQMETITSVTTQVTIDRAYEDTYVVAFNDDYEGITEYNSINRTLTISATRKTDAIGTGAGNIAVVSFPIPKDTKEGTIFTYTVKSGSYTDTSALKGSFSDSLKELDIVAAYTVTADTMVLGSNGKVYVTDAEGNPAAGISVYDSADSTVIGITDENGEITTDYFCQEEGSYEIYAQDDVGDISFIKKILCTAPAGTEDGKPYSIMSSTVKDAATQKNITWMANPIVSSDKAVMQYAEKSAYEASGEEAFASIEGNSTVIEFSAGDACSARVNSVYATGLAQNTTYVYRVGDGEIWSDTAEFTTNISGDESTSFFIIADIQSTDLTNTNTILNTVGSGDYEFGIQTGDGVDSATKYSYWYDFAQMFSTTQMNGKDVIHVLGNHEYEGNLSGDIAEQIYNLPGEDYYSVTYGNVYVAVINYTSSRSELQEALAWLAEDAANSGARWKILTMHQPPYYTNTTGGNGYINELVPSVVENAGIDFVFSGHDHCFARTAPLKAGEVNEADGTVYYICGSTGEKSYAAVDNPDFHFAKINDSYEAIYLTIRATKDSFAIVAKEADGTEIDSYVKYSACYKGHMYSYDEGILTCTVCGESANAADSDYTGLATDKQTGKTMYFKEGVVMTGVQSYNGVTYVFDDNGLAIDGDYTYVGVTYTFENGKFTSCTNSSVTSIIGMGVCEDGLRWIIDDSKTLRIDGEGAMKDYSSGSLPAWVSRQAYIHTAYIGKGITTIGKYGMFTLKELRNIYFEEGSQLTSIGAHAFQFAKFTSIDLPETVMSIGNYAFAVNGYLKEFEIPESLSMISYATFQGCTALEKVVIPETLTKIEDVAFDQCDKLTIYGLSDSPAEVYAEQNDIPFVATGAAMYAGSVTDTIQWTYTAGVLTLTGTGAMPAYNANGGQPWSEGSIASELVTNARIVIDTVDLTNSIKKVIIGKGITNVGAYAFFNHQNLTEVEFEAISKVTSIDKHAFHNTGLISIDLPETVTTFGNYAFAGCRSLREIEIPDGVTSLPYAAFEYCTNLEKVTIPSSVTDFGSSLFAGCDKVTFRCEEGSAAAAYAERKDIPVVVVDTTVEYSGTLGDSLKWSFNDGTLKISGTGAMPDYTISGGQPWTSTGADKNVNLQKEIKQIIIDKGVENIGAYAFYDATFVEDVTFAEGSVLKTIGKHGLQRLSIESINIPDSVTSMGNYALAECTLLKEVKIPAGVTFMNYALLEGCTSLEKVMISENVTFIENDILKNCPNAVVYGVQDGTAHYYSDKWGIPFKAEGYATYEGTLETGVTWKYYNNVLTFSGKGAIPDFENYYSMPWYRMDNTVRLQNRIKKVVIGEGITAIGGYAFFDAVKLSEVVFKGNNVTVIGKHSFRGTALSQITLPDSIVSIERYAFEGDEYLKEIIIPDSVEKLSYAAFMNCQGLDKAEISQSVTVIEDKVFDNCPNVVIYGAKDSVANEYATKNEIEFVALEHEVYEGYLTDTVFWEYEDGIMTISGIGAMPDYTTYSQQPWYKTETGIKLLSKIEKVIIEKGITRIGSYAFFDTPNLTTIEFEEGSKLKSIGKHAFHVSGLTEVSVPYGTECIERYAFAACSDLEKLEIPASVTDIQNDIVAGCEKVTIYGLAGSNADEYAKGNNVAFIGTEE